jgi:hypothetical protein
MPGTSGPARQENPAPLVFSDRRSHPRVAVGGTAILRLASATRDVGTIVTLDDISEGGISFRAPRELAIGTRIFLEMQPLTGSPRPQNMEAEIRWIASNPQTGQSRFGCAWMRPLSGDEVKRFC